MLPAALADTGRHADAAVVLDELSARRSLDLPTDFTAPLPVRYLAEVCRQRDAPPSATLLAQAAPSGDQLLLVSFGMSIEGARTAASAICSP